MDLDAGPAQLARADDLDPAAVAHAPQRAGGAEAEHRVGTGGEDRRRPRRFPRAQPVTDREDAAMGRVAARRHGGVSRAQLLDLGLGYRAIDERIARGLLPTLRSRRPVE